MRLCAAHEQRLAALPPLTVPEFTSDVVDNKNIVVACDRRRGVYLTVLAHFHGSWSSMEIDASMVNTQSRDASDFVD